MSKDWPDGLMEENKLLRVELEKAKLKAQVDDEVKKKLADRIMKLEMAAMQEVEH